MLEESHNVTQDDDIIVLDQRPTRNLPKSTTKRSWYESDDSICEIETKKSKTKEVIN